MIPVPRSIARIPILRGLYRIALNGYARLSRGRYTVEERMGLRLLLDLDNVVDQQVFVSGTWEKGTIDTLLGLAQEERQRHGGEAVFVDIGAHWGLYALLARQSGMFDRIVAFEPDPTNYGQLQANLFLNDATTAIEALQLATSDRERTFGLSLATRRNRGGTHVVEVAQANQVTCRAVRVDQQLDIADKLLVIKMDVEGHEMEAIDGPGRIAGEEPLHPSGRDLEHARGGDAATAGAARDVVRALRHQVRARDHHRPFFVSEPRA